jgi:lambda repressor-like predicted transcriptional regulator
MNDKFDSENGEVVYQRDVAQAADAPEFKPGATPHTQLGKETLNANIAWDGVVDEIVKANYTLETLATEVGISVKNIQNILQKNYDDLSFRIGARILRVHSQLFPEIYA